MITLDLQIESSAKQLPSEAQLLVWLSKALAGRSNASEITIRLVDEAESQQLNHDYRNKDHPTNVLSFPFQSPPGVELPILGDLVICAPVVQREAIEQHKSSEEHWAHMVVHGTLHLLGFDHIEAHEAEEMEQLEVETLAALGFADPYTEPAP